VTALLAMALDGFLVSLRHCTPGDDNMVFFWGNEVHFPSDDTKRVIEPTFWLRISANPGNPGER